MILKQNLKMILTYSTTNNINSVYVIQGLSKVLSSCKFSMITRAYVYSVKTCPYHSYSLSRDFQTWLFSKGYLEEDYQ